MGKLTDIWKNKGKILEGLKNSIFISEHIENLAEERMEKCNACPHIDKTGSKCAVPGTQPCCGLCGCSLHLKVRSLSSECADTENKQWDAVMTENEEDDLYSKLQ